MNFFGDAAGRICVGYRSTMGVTGLGAACVAFSLLATGGAEAQGGASAERVLAEITVTARRRTESLQDVPLAVSSINAEQIRQRGIQSEADLQASVPGLMVRVTNSSNQLNYSLRGQTVDSFSNSQPAVLAYVNEVQAGGVTTSSFFDLESVQVLKGPQGTLFGRNATGGAVLYQTKAPTDQFGGYFRAGAGNFSNLQFEGALNVPLSDAWAMRIAGLIRERDGWQKNLYNGDDLASIDTTNFRFSLGYTGDSVENQFVAYVGDHGGKTEGLRVRNAYTCLMTGGGVCLQGESNPNKPVGRRRRPAVCDRVVPDGLAGRSRKPQPAHHRTRPQSSALRDMPNTSMRSSRSGSTRSSTTNRTTATSNTRCSPIQQRLTSMTT